MTFGTESRHWRRAVTVVLMCCALLAPSGAASAQLGETVPPWHRPLPHGRAEAAITVGDTPLTVQLAVTPDEQTLGLGYRNGLDEGTGMLFVNENAQPRTFWMKGMRFCLDIIWIEGGQIVGAAERVCPDPVGTADADRARFESPIPVTYVLEVPAGWMDEQGYGPGTPVDLSRVP
ncbi:MAG TPA: DUF192 domain-containing protein [Thermomicrobiales bacterium]|nr:DUF192 domain-containing protein [Thermomicrobiales bacterium]